MNQAALMTNQLAMHVQIPHDTCPKSTLFALLPLLFARPNYLGNNDKRYKRTLLDI